MTTIAQGEPRKTTAVKSTETAKGVSSLARSYYARLQEASRAGEPIAWCMVSTPWDIYWAMGVYPVYTEHYATVCAAKQVGMPFIERAEGKGYANYTCSYARTGIGYVARYQELGGIPPEAAWGGMPKPTVYVGRGQCEPGYKWYQGMRTYLDAPIYIFDHKVTLPADLDYQDPAVERRYLDYEIGQLRSFIDFLERHTGKKLSLDTLSEVMKKHHEARALWAEVHKLRRAIPSPMPSGDMTTCIFPGYYLMGTQEAVDFYRKLRDEVKERVEKGIGVIPNERFRLLWGGIAQWHNLGFYNLLESYGAVFVIESNYYRDDFDEVDLSHPLEALARRYWDEEVKKLKRARAFGDVGDPRAGLILELARDYHVDGVILHLIFSCRPNAIGWAHTKNVLRDKLSVPALLMDSDICDPRAFSEAQTRAMVESFMETMASQKQRR